MSEVISQELFKEVSDAKTRQLLEQVVQRSGLSADEIKKTFDEKVNSEYVLQNICYTWSVTQYKKTISISP